MLNIEHTDIRGPVHTSAKVLCLAPASTEGQTSGVGVSKIGAPNMETEYVMRSTGTAGRIGKRRENRTTKRKAPSHSTMGNRSLGKGKRQASPPNIPEPREGITDVYEISEALDRGEAAMRRKRRRVQAAGSNPRHWKTAELILLSEIAAEVREEYGSEDGFIFRVHDRYIRSGKQTIRTVSGMRRKLKELIDMRANCVRVTKRAEDIAQKNREAEDQGRNEAEPSEDDAATATRNRVAEADEETVACEEYEWGTIEELSQEQRTVYEGLTDKFKSIIEGSSDFERREYAQTRSFSPDQIAILNALVYAHLDMERLDPARLNEVAYACMHVFETKVKRPHESEKTLLKLQWKVNRTRRAINHLDIELRSGTGGSETARRKSRRRILKAHGTLRREHLRKKRTLLEGKLRVGAARVRTLFIFAICEFI